MQPAAAEPAAQHHNRTGVPLDKYLHPISANLDINLAVVHDVLSDPHEFLRDL
jgi:hypothetical protein